MAIKGLADLLKKVREDSKYSDSDFEKELNKALAEDWIPKDKFNEVSEKYKTAQSQIDSNSKLMKELQDKGNLADEYKTKIDEMSKTHKSQLDELNKTLIKQKKDSAIERFLDKAGSLNNKATRALLNDEAITLSEGGELIGMEEQLKTLKKDNAFLFKTEESKEDEEDKNPRFRFGGGDPNPNPKGGNDQSSLEKLFGL